MTLQQLEYVVALDRYRHFVKAAEACNVTQSTLSMMIRKLEEELDVQIFDRNARPIAPTDIGEKLIMRAKSLLANAQEIHELVASELAADSGEVKLGVIPTIAPYALPGLFKTINERYPKISLRVTEATTAELLNQLDSSDIDMALLATPLSHKGLLEIPVYYEKFAVYVSPNEPLYEKSLISQNNMPTDHLWLLMEGHCLRNQVLNICNAKSGYSSTYEAGNISTLVRIIDANDGYTLIPELHIALLTEEQQKNVRHFSAPEPVREVSLVIRHDYVRERMLNIISECLRSQIPDEMVDSGLKKYAIKL